MTELQPTEATMRQPRDSLDHDGSEPCRVRVVSPDQATTQLWMMWASCVTLRELLRGRCMEN